MELEGALEDSLGRYSRGAQPHKIRNPSPRANVSAVSQNREGPDARARADSTIRPDYHWTVYLDSSRQHKTFREPDPWFFLDISSICEQEAL